MKLTAQFKKSIILICVFFGVAAFATGLLVLNDRVSELEHRANTMVVTLPTPTISLAPSASPTASPTAALKPTITTKKVVTTPTKAVDR